MEELEVRVLRSHGRIRTISAREVHGVLEVRAPAGIADADLQPIIQKLQDRIARRKAKHEQRATLEDAYLQQRATVLNERYFDGALTWSSLVWSTAQDRRWGSCTRTSATIRISHRLAPLPAWVLDAVIVHELAHLLESNHSARFWRLANRYPLMERARGYLMAISAAAEEAM